MIYDSTNIARGRKSGPKIRLSNDHCYLNTESCKLTGFKVGDKIAFRKEEGEWYFFKSNNGFGLYKSNGKPTYLFFSCANFVKVIQEDISVFDSLLMKVSPESTNIGNTKCFLILTASAKKNQNGDNTTGEGL